MHVFGIDLYQRTLESENLALSGQDICAQSLRDVSLAILVERHEFVHAEHVQFHKEHVFLGIPDHLRDDLMYIIVLGNGGSSFRI